MARYAISDIHGCAATFAAALAHIRLVPEDDLYLLGDYIDRGPDSGGVIDQILKLKAEGYRVHCLRGNHEQMYLNEYAEACRDASVTNIPKETVTSFGVDDIRDTPGEYLYFMQHLPYYLLLPDYVLVHAGLNFRVADPLQQQETMLWIRYWYEDINRTWLGDRIIVHGHTPVPRRVIDNSTRELALYPAINIDAGCPYQSSGFGHLCVLDLDQRSCYFQPRIDKVDQNR